MSEENSTPGLAEPSDSSAADDPSQLERVGQFVLGLIRQTASLAREAAPDEAGAPAKNQIEALEAQIDQYRDMERQTALCGTLLTETQRNLHDRTEEAKASYRKFVDASAQLQTANEEIFNLRKALEDKERELTALKRDSMQLVSYMRALVEIIDERRSKPHDLLPPVAAIN